MHKQAELHVQSNETHGLGDRHDVSALIGGILTCSSFQDVGQRILKPLARSLNCTSAYLAQIGSSSSGVRSHVERSVFIGPIKRTVDAYAAGEFRRCPLLAAEPNRLLSMCRMEQELEAGQTSSAGRESLRYWRAWLARQGQVGDTTGIVVPVHTSIGPHLVALMFHRGREFESFDDGSIGLLNEAIPALRVVLGNLVMAETSLFANQIMSALADANAVGFVLFDEAMKIRYANERGTAAIAAGNSRRAAGDRVDASVESRIPASGRFSRDTHVTTLSNATGETFRLSMTTRSDPSRSFDHLRRAYGLTARETEVVKTITEGHSNSSAAERLGIAVRTVENHLRAIYAKIGIGTRTQLVSRAVSAN
jgi:DNA-binding CsgD family transcriptional regulator